MIRIIKHPDEGLATRGYYTLERYGEYWSGASTNICFPGNWTHIPSKAVARNYRDIVQHYWFMLGVNNSYKTGFSIGVLYSEDENV